MCISVGHVLHLPGLWTGPVFIFGGAPFWGEVCSLEQGWRCTPTGTLGFLTGGCVAVFHGLCVAWRARSQARFPPLLAVCVPPPVKCLLLFSLRLPPMDGPLHAGPFRAEVCILVAHSFWVSKLCHQGEAGHADTSPKSVSVESGGVCRRRAWGRRGVQRRWCR